MSNVVAITETGTVTTALTDIGSEIVLGGDCPAVAVQVTNTGGTNATNDFAVLIRTHAQGTFETLLSGAITNALPHLRAIGTPNALAAAATAVLIVQVGPIYSVKFQAKTAAATTTVTVRGLAGGIG